jgi:hypothetical protein
MSNEEGEQRLAEITQQVKDVDTELRALSPADPSGELAAAIRHLYLITDQHTLVLESLRRRIERLEEASAPPESDAPRSPPERSWADFMAERSYDEIEHELEAALTDLQTHPPQTLEALTIAIVHLQTLSQERTDLVLEALLARVQHLENRVESLGPPPS